MKGVVSKETVVLRQWGCSIQKFGQAQKLDQINLDRSLNSGCVPFSKSGFGLQNRDFRDSVYKMKHEIRNTIFPADSRLVPSPPALSLVFRGY